MTLKVPKSGNPEKADEHYMIYISFFPVNVNVATGS